MCDACHSAKIVYCTRLKQAQTEEAREVIRVEMRADVSGGGAAILEALEKTKTAENWERDRTGALVDRVRKEAKTLGTTESGNDHSSVSNRLLRATVAISSCDRQLFA